MKYINIGQTDMKSSAIILGCMRISDMSDLSVRQWIDEAMVQGINTFDHADIYGQGICEEKFGRALKEAPGLRESMFLQSKCGIRKGFYDLSGAYIAESVDNSLRRLHTDYLDLLILHRPDVLAEPKEIGRTLKKLKESGKVRHFGVSNMNSMQVEMLKSFTDVPFCVDQIQMSIAHTPAIDSGIFANMYAAESADRSGNILEYCRKEGMTVQAWSVLQYGIFEGTFLYDGDGEGPADGRYKSLNQVLGELAVKYGVSKASVAIAWLLRHPSGMQAVVGTTKPLRIREAAAASDIYLTKEEWYRLYCAAGHELP